MPDMNHMGAAPNPGMVLAMINAHRQTAALKAAIDLDLFRAIGEGPGNVAFLARQCASSERGIRILCDFLAMSGLIEKHGQCYRHSPTSAVFLDPTSPASMASVAQFMCNPAINDVYNQLAEVVRNGRTSLAGEGTVEPENPLWVDFARKMAPMTGPMAGPLAGLVLEGRSGPMQVLDIAAGHGLFGIEIARRNPEAHITGLDWAPVLNVALENAQKAGVTARYRTLPGSAFDVEFGGPYDAVLLTNFLHHFEPQTSISLLRKVHAALASGGCAATLEFVPNDDRISPPAAAGFSMTMLTTTASGDAYTFRELKSMYEDAGFASVTEHNIPMSPQTVVLGQV